MEIIGFMYLIKGLKELNKYMKEINIKRSLYFTKTFLFSAILYLSLVYQPLVNYIYEGEMTKDDFTALLVGTFGFLGVSGSRARVNDDIRASADSGTPVGLVTSNLLPTKKNEAK